MPNPPESIPPRFLGGRLVMEGCWIPQSQRFYCQLVFPVVDICERFDENSES